MNHQDNEDLQRQLEATCRETQDLEKQCAVLRQRIAWLEDYRTNYKPLAVQWIREHLPATEELEKELAQVKADPTAWVSSEVILKDIREALDACEMDD